MKPLGYLFVAIVVLVYSVWSHLAMYRKGYRDGRRDEEKQRLKNQERYFAEMEHQVGTEREKIWREES